MDVAACMVKYPCACAWWCPSASARMAVVTVTITAVCGWFDAFMLLVGDADRAVFLTGWSTQLARLKWA